MTYFPFYIRLVTSVMYLGGKKTDLFSPLAQDRWFGVSLLFRHEDKRTRVES